MAITVTGGPAYGWAWNKTTDTGTRVASAAGLTAGASFNSIAPWTAQRCNLWDDGTPTAYYGDRCYTDTDVANMGQAMVQIPKCYYLTAYDAGTTTYYWFLTTNASTSIDLGLGAGAQTVKIDPAFSRGGVIKDNIYISAYEGYHNPNTLMLESKSGVLPSSSMTLAQFRTAAELRAGSANKWEVQDYLSHSLVQRMYLIEYGGFDSQTLLGAGITNAAAVQNTGYTSTLGNASGNVNISGAVYAMSYRGIENLYGNQLRLIDGLNVKGDYHVWVADHNFVSCITGDTSTGFDGTVYKDTTLGMYPLNLSTGWIGDITINTATPYSDVGFIPAANTGSATTRLYDNFAARTLNRIMAVSAIYNEGSSAGAFRVSIWSAPETTSTVTGSRLMYIG